MTPPPRLRNVAPSSPPPEELPGLVPFSLEEVLRRVRRTNKSSAGGLSGSNYKTMQARFYESDSLAENLATLLNRIAAGRVPASITPLLTAGITKFFLEPKPLQFAVGLAGGCELMGAAIGALLSEHVGWVDVAADAVRCGVLSSRTFRT